jgi:hypothetical protein
MLGTDPVQRVEYDPHTLLGMSDHIMIQTKV